MLAAIAPLTPEEEHDLIPPAQRGDADATARLIRSQVRYLWSEANKYRGSSPLVEAEDLVSAGVEALLGALKTFDPSRGTRFWTHARPAIQLAMAEELAAFTAQIRIPGRTLRKYFRAIRETETLEEARDLARSRDGMDPQTFDAVRFALIGGESVDAVAVSGAAGSPGASGKMGRSYGGAGRAAVESALSSGADFFDASTPMLGARGDTPEGTALSRDLARQALASLDERARTVVTLAYYSEEPVSDGDIALRLGVSRPTVTRIRNAALEVMRDALA